jgi:presequence protease
MKQDYLCVMGNEEKIKANKDVFGRLINVFD